MKKIAVIFILLLSLIIITACEETPDKESAGELNFTLSEDGESYAVSGIGNVTDTKLVIPAEYQGKPVLAVADGAFSGNTSITAVEFSDSTVLIGARAFSGCTALENVKLTESLIYIREQAFSGCTALRELTIYENVNGATVDVEGGAFENCTSLVTVSLPEGMRALMGRTFDGCSSLKSINIPESMINIYDYAFSGCSALEAVKLPDGLKYIGTEAFANCTSLTEIKIPSIRQLGNYAFIGCTGLKTVTLSQMNKIGHEAFRYCSALENIYYLGSQADWEDIGKYPLWDDQTGDYELHFTSYFSNGLEFLRLDDGRYAVSGIGSCTDTELNIPSKYNGVPVIGIAESAFLKCNTITKVIIPSSVESIADDAFYWCSELLSVEMRKSVKKIGEDAFYYCRRLVEFRYTGSAEDWHFLDKGERWDMDTGEYKVYCSDKILDK